MNDGPITIPTPNVCLRTLWRLFFAIIEHGIKPQFLSREFRSDYSYILDANHGAYRFNMLKDSNNPVFNVKTTTGAWDGIIGKSKFLFPCEKMWTQDGKRFWPEFTRVNRTKPPTVCARNKKKKSICVLCLIGVSKFRFAHAF